MPFEVVDDEPMQVRMLDPDELGRLHGQAQHPSSRGASRLADIHTPYKPLLAPVEASWPRAGIRPIPLLGGPGHSWAVKLWAAQGVPLVERSIWVTEIKTDLGEAVDWAAVEVARRRPKPNPANPLESPC